MSDVLSDEPLRLARDERRELVTKLADEGMSTRAIAPIVGAGHVTVARDLSTVSNETVEAPSEPACAHPATVVRVTTGLDAAECAALEQDGRRTVDRMNPDRKPALPEGMAVEEVVVHLGITLDALQQRVDDLSALVDDLTDRIDALETNA